MSQGKDIFIYADWMPFRKPLLIGCAHVSVVRGKEVIAFEYHSEWLEQRGSLMLDPRLYFTSGVQYPDRAFGLFLDSAPDRWGRQLIQRREALRAKEEGRKERPFFESDYLLQVHDVGRMGGLRFKLDPESHFVSADRELATPPLQALRELEHASLELERNRSQDSDENRRWLHLLLAPGTSLGGARPKANVVDPQGNLWIAKFPSRSDEVDVGAWEMVVYHLAKEAGLKTVQARTEAFSKNGSTFLVKRFDRLGEKRIHFASALNLLGYQDGEGAKTGASYLELADLIQTHGEAVADDLEELWKRIVFNICVRNTDDHLRNHGFLLGEQGWRLSPVYDLNPQPWDHGLALNISESSNALDLDLALSVADVFRIGLKRREELLQKIRQVVQGWESVAKEQGLSRQEMERMRQAFQTAR
jgi:serine/threonine-protein kinase HipA